MRAAELRGRVQALAARDPRVGPGWARLDDSGMEAALREGLRCGPGSAYSRGDRAYRWLSALLAPPAAAAAGCTFPTPAERQSSGAPSSQRPGHGPDYPAALSPDSDPDSDRGSAAPGTASDSAAGAAVPGPDPSGAPGKEVWHVLGSGCHLPQASTFRELFGRGPSSAAPRRGPSISGPSWARVSSARSPGSDADEALRLPRSPASARRGLADRGLGDCSRGLGDRSAPSRLAGLGEECPPDDLGPAAASSHAAVGLRGEDLCLALRGGDLAAGVDEDAAAAAASGRHAGPDYSAGAWPWAGETAAEWMRSADSDAVVEDVGCCAAAPHGACGRDDVDWPGSDGACPACIPALTALCPGPRPGPRRSPSGPRRTRPRAPVPLALFPGHVRRNNASSHRRSLKPPPPATASSHRRSATPHSESLARAESRASHPLAVQTILVHTRAIRAAPVAPSVPHPSRHSCRARRAIRA